jgi:hypothetical protein
MSSPTSREPVKAIRATRGSRTSAAPVVSPGRGAEVQHIARAAVPRPPAASRRMSNMMGDAGRLLGGLDDDGVARDQRGDGHAAADRQREVPGADDDGDAARLVPLLVELADEPPERLRARRGMGGQAGVVLAEVDGLADIGVGLAPGLAGLLDHDAGEPVALLRMRRPPR